ncbi:hypothetical protein Q31b_17860 [Novipirellula aureliae]|uniref:Uncharacterized protein n=1 Tax=Novipirellula aureliae TaxID=2527966 RepID=A0A5C6E5Z8_9BACT|nr:hypothetical protein Q31b_17860 [Novipirellula aureliae]
MDEASAPGGGVVLFHPGEYRTATIFLIDNVTLRLEKDSLKETKDSNTCKENLMQQRLFT